MFEWLKRLWTGRASGAIARGVTSDVPIVYADGFVPKAQFESANLQTLYDACEFAYACITANSLQAASLGVQTQRLDGNRWVRTSDVPELDALTRSPSGPVVKGKPSAPPQWTWSQLVFLQASSLYLDGNAYLKPLVVRGGQRIFSVAPLLSSAVTVEKSGETGYPTRYRAGAETYRPDEVVHTLYTSPLWLHKGHAPIRAALRSLNIDYATMSRIQYNLDNKVNPGLIVKSEGFMGMSNDQRLALEAFFKENYQGAAQDGRPLVFGEGSKIEYPKSTNSLVDYGALFSHVVTRILAVMHTPPPIVGVYDNATLQNFKEAFKIWWLVALFPLLELLYNTINLQLIWPIYGPDVRLWFDDRNSPIALLMQHDKGLYAKLLVDMGLRPNAAFREAGLDIPHFPELDVPLMNLAVAGRTPPTETAA